MINILDANKDVIKSITPENYGAVSGFMTNQMKYPWEAVRSKLDHKAYKMFLQEFETRFSSIPELSQSNVIVSVETTSPVTREMASVIHKPFIENGFNKKG